MSTFQRVGIVGLGRMGLTLAAAFSRAVGPDRVYGVGRSAASITRFGEIVPRAAIMSLQELPGAVRLIILCTPTADLPTVFDGLRPCLTADHVVVTISNRMRLRALADAVPGPVAKLIPSAGNELGAGATLLVPGPRLTEQAMEDLLCLLRTFSTPFVIEEHQGRAATDLASCGPALLAAATAAMADAQYERGAPLPRDKAEELAMCSLKALGLLVGSGASLADIIDRVAVPGGNTAAAIAVARGDLIGAWHAAFQATEENERSRQPASRAEL